MSKIKGNFRNEQSNLKTGTQDQLSSLLSERSCPTCIIGQQGTGKSTLVTTAMGEGIKRGEINVLLDLGSFPICDNMQSLFNLSSDEYMEIDLNNQKQDLGFLDSLKETTPSNVATHTQVQVLTNQLIHLLESVMPGSDMMELTIRSKRYLLSACLVAFINECCTIRSIFDILFDSFFRATMLSKIPEGKFEDVESTIAPLRHLPKDNNYSATPVEPILDRYSFLLSDSLLRNIILESPILSTYNLTDALSCGKVKLIVIKNSNPNYKVSRYVDCISLYTLERVCNAIYNRTQQADGYGKVNLFWDSTTEFKSSLSWLAQEHLARLYCQNVDVIMTFHHFAQLRNIKSVLDVLPTKYIVIGSHVVNNPNEIPYSCGIHLDEINNLPRFHCLGDLARVRSHYSNTIMPLPVLFR